MVSLGISVPLAGIYGMAALFHAIFLIPGSYVKAHVNLLALCGNVVMLFASSMLFVSDATTLVTAWFWFFVLTGSVIYYQALAFYLFTDRTARLGGLVCELSANLAILLLLLNPVVADNVWVQGMLILSGVALISLSSLINLLYRFRSGWRPVAIIAINLLAHILVTVSVLLSPKFVDAGSTVLWDVLIAVGLIIQHVVIAILCMWYTEANSNLRSFPVIAVWMGIQKEIDNQGGLLEQSFPVYQDPTHVITSGSSTSQNNFVMY